MTFNVKVHGNYQAIIDHIASYPNPVKKKTYEDFNGQTMHRGVEALGFQTEEERFKFILSMADKLYMCESTDKDFKWGHTEF